VDATSATDAGARLREVEQRLDARGAWSWSRARLDELFGQGRVPSPAPSGFLRGRPILLSVSEPVDALARRLGGDRIPWQGKRFDAGDSSGINVLRVPGGSRRVERFPFRLHVGPGAVPPIVDVLKIDYDIRGNQPWIRRTLDELVEIADGEYLGRALYRWGESHRLLGYFALER
jgi:hypothetical protein